MNKERRNRLLDAASQLDEAMDTIREVIDDEQEAFDNMPEGFQNGARGEAMMEAIDQMESFVDGIERVQIQIEEFGRG